MTFVTGVPRLMAVLFAATLLPGVRASADAPSAPTVNVRWAADVSEEQRMAIARQYSLEVIEREDRTWVCRLLDTSRDNIRGIVQDPRIEDTHGIDREGHTVGRRDRIGPGFILSYYFPSLASFYRNQASDMLTWNRLPLAVAFVMLGGLFARAVKTRHAPWLLRGMPELSAEAVGLYRIALGAMLIWAVWIGADVGGGLPREMHRNQDWFAQWEWIRRLAAHPSAVVWLRWVTVAALVSFTIGLWTRVSLLLSAATLTVCVLVMLQHKSAHDWGLPTLTLWLLTGVRWGDALSVDVLRTGHRERQRRPPAVPYGMAAWIPGLTLGVAFLAAAFAKLDTSGIAWITGGAIRYHFVEDAAQAPVSWGTWLASRDTLTVAASLAAVAIEATLWLVLCTRRASLRASVGLIGLTLLGGFYLFQGVFWPAWWALFLAFVPWQPLATRIGAWLPTAAVVARAPTLFHPSGLPPRTPAATLPIAYLLVLALFVLQQIVASAARIEEEPFVSDYAMYARTWPSKEEFNRQSVFTQRQYSFAVDGDIDADELRDRLRKLPEGIAVLESALDQVLARRPLTAGSRAALQSLAALYGRKYGTPLERLHVRADSRVFDWTRGQFETHRRVVLVGELHLPSGMLRRSGAAEIVSRDSEP